MTGSTTTVGIEVRADGTQEAARDLAVVDASLKKIQTDLGGTAQPAGVAAQGLEQLGAAGKSAGAGLGAVGASAKKAAEGLGSVSKLAASAKFDKVVSDLGAIGVKLNANSLHAQKLAKAMQQVERERAFQQLAADANLSTLQLAKFRAEMGDTRGALATLTNGFGLSKAAVLAFAAALAFGGKAALDAALQMDRLEKAYTTITGSSAAAQTQLSYLYDVSNRLGLQFQSTAASAKTFFAAGKSTSLEKDLNGIFEAVSSAGAALSLSQDDMQGAFLALGQMISKGKVQSEELRGQLGERLPGAFQLAAKAMNMTTAQLDKFMADGKLTAEDLLPKLAKVMREDFGAAAETASQGLQGAINRLSTEWTLFKSSLIDSDAAVVGIDAVRGAVGGLQAVFDALSEYSSVFKAFAVGAGVTAGVVALAAALKVCLPLLTLFTGALDVNAALAFSGGVMGIQKAMVALRAAMVAHPILAFAAVLGTVAAAVSYLVDEYGAEAEKLKVLDGAQETAAASAKELANAHKMSAQELANYIAKLEEQEEKLRDVEAGVRARLSEQGFYGLEKMDTSNEYVIAAYERLGEALPTEQLNQFEQALEDAKASALQTSDWRTLLAELDKIEREAKASGDYTDNFRAAIENARAAARDGITFNIRIREVREVVTKYIEEQSQRNKSANVLAAEMEARQRQIELDDLARLKGEYLKQTDEGRVEALKQQRVEIQKQLGLLDATTLTQAERNEKAKYLNAQLTTTNEKIDSILKKGQKKDNGLEQAQRNLDAYTAELGKTEAAITSLRAQLAAPVGDVFTREQAKITAEYEATIKSIEKQAADYARKKGISTEQARQLRSQKEIEAGLKRDLALREAQEKEEKRLADLAKDRYEFYKELEEITGQYGLSLQFQSEVIAAQVKELERLQIPQQYIDQWKQLKELQASKDWADGAVRGIMRFKAEASDTASQTEDAFNGFFSSIQSSTQSMWEDFLETGKLSLSSLKSVFKSFIAQLLNIAIMNPIIVQVATSVQGSLWGGSAGSVLAGAAQSGASGGVNSLAGNIPISNLIPDAVKSTASGVLGATLPGTVSTLTTPGAYSAGEVLLMQTPGTTAGTIGGQAALTSSGLSLGSALSYGGWGGLGYSTLGSMVGLPQSKYSGLTAGLGGALGAWGASAAGTAAGVAAGSTMGSVIPVVGTAIGAIIGGIAGSLIGGGRKTHASVYGKMEDVGFSRDASTYSDAFMQGAWYDRAGATEAQPFADTIGQAAATTAGTILDLAAALPDEYRKQVQDKLASATWTAGRGISGASWNLQWWKEGMAEERTTEAINDMIEQMGYAANAAFANAGIGNLFDTFDLSTEDGLTKASNAVNSINTITTAIDQLKNPTSDVEAQATAFVEQIDALKTSVKSYGVNASYADALVEQYRTAYVDSYVKSLDEMFNPLSEIEQQAQSYKTTIDSYVAALTTMGASEEQLAKVRGYTQSAIDSILSSLGSAFDPLSDVEQQTLATMQSLTAYEAALKTLGATADELAKVDEARAKVQADLRSQAETYISTTPQIVTQTKATIEKLDNLHGAMLVAGNSAADLALIEQGRAKVQADLLTQVNAYIEAVPDVVSSTRDTMTSLLGLRDAMIEAGVSAEGMTRIDAAWGKMQAGLLTQARDMVQTVPTVTSALAGVNSGFDGLRQAMEEAGSGIAAITELEELRAQALNKAKAAYSVAFFEDLSARTATITGGDVTGIQLDATHRKQLEEAANTFGKDTAEYAALVAVQQAEQLKHQADLAQAAADAATSAYNTAKSSADSLAAAASQTAAAVTSAQQAAENARLALVKGLIDALVKAKAAIQSALDAWVSGAEDAYKSAKDAYVSALNTEASELESTIDAHRRLAEALRQTRRDLWLDTSLNSRQSVYKSSKSEVNRLYGLAMSGDTDAANELQSVAKTFLSASYASQSDFADYIKDFDEVQQKLKAVEDEATRQADAQETELAALKKQIDAQTETTKSVEELRVEMESARAVMERAQAEQKRVYARWGLESVVPGIDGLEAEYRKQAEALRVAERDLNSALLEGLTTQSEIDALRVTSSIDTLRDTLSTSLAAIETAIAENARAQDEAARAAAAAAAAKAEADRLAAEAAQKQQAAANAAQSAQDKVNEAVNIYGSNYATVDALLAAKLDSLHRGEFIDPAFGIAASDWTWSAMRQAMIDTYGSIEAWYKNAGVVEGFAVGGLAMPGWAMVGECGPELVNFSTPGRVYTAEQTQRMLAQPAYGTDGSSAAQLAWMRERMDRQTAVMEEMAGILKNIRTYSYRVNEGIENINENGIATTAKTTAVQRTTFAE